MSHFKLEMQRRNLVPRMIVCISQLRLPIEQLLFGGGTLIYAGEQIDQMLAGSSGCGESEHDVAVTVESAHVSHVGVIVCRNIDVVVLRPTHPFEMNRDWSSDGS